VADAPCLIVGDTDELYSGTDPMGSDPHYGCSAGEFPATVGMRVDTQLPDGIRSLFADGTGLQFVLTGDTVEVYADHAPTAAPTPFTPTPHPQPTPLAIPHRVDGEIARAVVHPNDDGQPAVTNYLTSAPRAGVAYALEAKCTSARQGVDLHFELRTTDRQPAFLLGGSVRCNGPATTITGPLETDLPPQILFTATAGVRDAYARVIPAP
jgi:hypothetical protein